MKSMRLLALLSLIIFAPQVCANDKAFKAVQDLFAGMSAFDYEKMRDVVTPDFQLLEVGEVWDLDDLIRVVKPSGKKYERRNYFSVIKVAEHTDTVWVSYWNKADFIVEGKARQVGWLESAVMIKSGNDWKVQMLHSTRVDIDKIPADVIFQEYQ